MIDEFQGRLVGTGDISEKYIYMIFRESLT